MKSPDDASPNVQVMRGCRTSEWWGDLIGDSTVDGDLIPETGYLARGEAGHARVVGVVHVVVDGVNGPTGAGITRSGATIGGGSLRRGIGDRVTTGASTLEGVVEPDPVSDLMGRGASEVVGGKVTSRKGLVENNDTVILGTDRVVEREGGVTEETLAISSSETDGVEVERAGGSHSVGVLHGGLFGAVWSDPVEPVGVHDPSGVHQLEVETGAEVVFVQNADLPGDLAIFEVTSIGGLVGVDNVNVDRDREIGSNGVDLAANVALGDKRGEGLLILAEVFGSDISTTFATGGPRLDAMEPVGVGGNGDDNSGERKESDECGGKAEQHDEDESVRRERRERRKKPGGE
jgi:hypothetical protein